MEPVFTGIVEGTGRLTHATTTRDGGRRITIALGAVAQQVRLGDSISVSGCCLSVAALDGDRADFDLSGETLAKTTLGGWQPGRQVNLERALRLGDRLGGHLVGGHVDGVGRLLAKAADAQGGWRFDFALDPQGAVKVVEKGSVSVDGISLTTWACTRQGFSVAVIPHTLAVTTLGSLAPGDAVNLEQDAVGRWVEALLAPHLASALASAVAGLPKAVP